MQVQITSNVLRFVFSFFLVHFALHCPMSISSIHCSNGWQFQLCVSQLLMELEKYVWKQLQVEWKIISITNK